MDSRSFPAALWGQSWDSIVNEEGSCQQGLVAFDKDYGISLEIPFGQILESPGVLVHGREKLPDRLDWLYGFAQDGTWLALADVIHSSSTSTTPGGPKQSLRAHKLFFSNGRFNPSAKVACVRIGINGLGEWIGSFPMLEKMEHSDGGKLLSWGCDVDLRPETQNINLFENDMRSVKLVTAFSSRYGLETGAVFDLRRFVVVDFKMAVAVGDAEELIFQLIDFFSFCFGLHAEIASIDYSLEETGTKVGCLMPLVNGSSKQRPRNPNMPFPYSRIKDDIGRLLGNWLDFPGDLRESVSLTSSLMFKEWKLPLDLKFIAASQLLELLSKHDTDLRALSVADYKRRCDGIKEAVKGVVDDASYEWLCHRLDGNSKGQKKLLQELCEKHACVVSAIVADAGEFIKLHIAARNRHTHLSGNKSSAVTAKQLYLHTEIVLLLCYCFILECAGLKPERILECIECSNFKRMQKYQAGELYGAKSMKAAQQESGE